MGGISDTAIGRDLSLNLFNGFFNGFQDIVAVSV